MNENSVLEMIPDDSDDSDYEFSKSDDSSCEEMEEEESCGGISESSDRDDAAESDGDMSQTTGTTRRRNPTELRDVRKNYVWTDADEPPAVAPFSGRHGPTDEVIVTDVDSPYDYFKLIFTDSFIDFVVSETNIYAKQCLTKVPLTPRARGNNWKAVTAKELEVFLGLVLLTGLVDKRSSIASYWSADPPLATPFFNQTMPRDRFQIISRYLHFNDNEAVNSDCPDKLHKIRPVYDYLVDKWRELYSLGEHIAIGEAMLKWTGRHSFRGYNKEKLIQYGIKSYILADSDSAYCWNMDVHRHEKKTLKQTVQRLLSPKCFGVWHTLYMDNLYNSVELSQDLLLHKVHTVGTLRSNRGEPVEFRRLQDMPRHAVIAKNNGKVTVIAWKHVRIVKFITTKHDGSVMTVWRKKKGGCGEMEDVKKPVCVFDYNAHMSGVDRIARMMSYYPCTHKSSGWSRKFFYYLLEVSVHNSHVLYQAKSRNSMTLYDFQKKVIAKMCGRPEDGYQDFVDDPTPPSRVPRHDPHTRLRGGFKAHRMKTLPATLRKKYPQRCCRVCSRKQIRKETRYFCSKCNIPLCVSPCFADYHVKKKLK